MHILQIPIVLSGFQKQDADLRVLSQTGGYYTTSCATAIFVSNNSTDS